MTITSETVNLDQSECRKVNSYMEIYIKTVLPSHCVGKVLQTQTTVQQSNNLANVQVCMLIQHNKLFTQI